MARMASMSECFMVRQLLRWSVVLMERQLIHVVKKGEGVAASFPIFNKSAALI